MPKRRAACLAIIGCLAVLLTVTRPGVVFAGPVASPDKHAATTDIASLAPDPPALQSPSAILVDAASGDVLLAKNAHEKRNPASVTKLMTLAVTYDAVSAGQVHWDDPVQASAHAASMGGSQVFLSAGETFTLGNLTAAVAIASANDAAMAVAEHVAGSEGAFVQRMQALATKIGMRDSSFKNPHGLDADGHVMSAYDIALLSRYLVEQHPEILSLTSTWMRPFRDPPREFTLVNTNKLLKRFAGVDGLKTGWTSQAGYSVSITAVRGDTRLIAVVLGANTTTDRWDDITAMLNWGFANFESVRVAARGAVLGQPTVVAGRERQVAAIAPLGAAITVRKGQAQKVKTRVELPSTVPAPVRANDRIGTLVVTLDGKTMARVPLVAKTAVARAPLGLLFVRMLSAAWPG